MRELLGLKSLHGLLLKKRGFSGGDLDDYGGDGDGDLDDDDEYKSKSYQIFLGYHISNFLISEVKPSN